MAVVSRLFAPLLTWLDADPVRYWSVAWLLFAVCLGLAVLPGTARGAGRLGRPLLFVAAIFGCLLAFRWPVFFLPVHLNIDESQMIAGAMTLRHDPVFWRSVEGQTIGPLDYYALIPATFLNDEQAFFGPRLLALLLAGAVVVLGYLSARLVLAERMARASVLPLLAFFACTMDANYVAYSSEYVPIALVAAALYCLLRSGQGGSGRWAFAAGVALGAAPLAKLQVAPLVAWLMACGAWYFVRAGREKRRSTLAPLLGGFVLVGALAALAAVAFGVGRDMRISYFEANLFYVETNREGASRLGLWGQILATMFRNPSFVPLLVSTLLVTGVAAVARRKFAGPQAWLLTLGVGGVLAAMVCALLGSRAYGHYFLLQVPAITLAVAWALERIDEASAEGRRGLVWAAWVLFLGAGVAWPAVACLREGSPFAGKLREYRAMGDGPPSAAVDELKRWVKPGEPLAVWGWEPPLYLRTGAWQATRDPSTRRQVEPSAQLGYFRARYLHDLEVNQPRVLIDATGARRKGYGFENFPEFRDYLDRHFRLVAEVEARRIYVRRERDATGENFRAGVGGSNKP